MSSLFGLLLMFRYAVTITLSAFLLFQVQPLIARFILPWFGGTPAVWTTCLLFFQVVLLLGYGYAHGLVRWFSPRGQMIVHIVLVAVALSFLPIIPDAAWKPTGEESPTWRILVLLAITIGLPYAVLSTSGPLMQAWFSRTHPGRSPYRLFALSNLGSLVALISYPILFEPNLTLPNQAIWWSGGFALFAALAAWSAYSARRGSMDISSIDAHSPDDTVIESAIDIAFDKAGADNERQPPRPWMDWLLWLGLSMFPSILLLATTSQLCQEVAVVPFLWVLPLSLYLLTFIICFDSPRWYVRSVWGLLMIVFVIIAALSLGGGVSVPMWLQLVGFAGALFVCCMCCHGELARAKPPTQHLTLFYLLVSLGGALGGVFVVVIAPLVFVNYIELQIALAACVSLTWLAYYRRLDWWLTRWYPIWITAPGLGLVSLSIVLLLVMVSRDSNPNTIDKRRGFYGTLTVSRVSGGDSELGDYLTLRHGRIKHGFQYLAPENRMLRTSYYAESSGVGRAIMRHPRRIVDPNADLNIGVIGLGTGTLAAFGQPGDRICFYEISADVIQVANEVFQYVGRSEADVKIVLGDARVQLERQAESDDLQQFDVLAVDAFSSDAIPMHLLTRECIALYQQHLKPDGILCIHISNRFLDLRPIVYHVGRDRGFSRPKLVTYDPRLEAGPKQDDSSSWVLLTNNRPFLDDPDLQDYFDDWPEDMRKVIWTDDFGSLWQVLR